MRILLSNDDGVHAPGIQTLAKALREFADVQVVAPDRNRSGASNSLTLESSLRTFTFENGDIAVQMGTPTDCVYLGVNALMRPRPDIVVSGINAGPNLGDDVIYSGTVGVEFYSNVLLQVMDYATLTDNQGRKADFRNVVVIMTSNAGANRLGKSGIGFISESMDESVLTEAVKNTFQPEFRNRLNKIVVFNSMDDDMASMVVEKKLKELSEQLQAKKITLSADKKAKTLLKTKGVSQEFGAREIDRVIRNDVKPLFVDEILFGKLKNGGKIKLTTRNKDFVIETSKK